MKELPDDFGVAVTVAVRAGGDTDTAGAMTGAWSGARVGLAGIPSPWRTHVEGREAIVALARELYHVAREGDGWR